MQVQGGTCMLSGEGRHVLGILPVRIHSVRGLSRFGAGGSTPSRRSSSLVCCRVVVVCGNPRRCGSGVGKPPRAWLHMQCLGRLSMTAVTSARRAVYNGQVLEPTVQ